MKLKKNNKFVVATDGSAASGKTTGAKIISRKYGLKFLSSGLLYRFVSYQLLRAKPKNKIKFLKLKFKNLDYNKITKINLHTSKISEHTSIIAKQKKIRNILKKFQRDFVSKHKRVCIEARDIGTIILPKADLKFFFKCNLDIAAKRRFKELKKKNKLIKFKNVKKELKNRNLRDISRKNSPLLKSPGAVIVDTGKTKNITMMVKLMCKFMDRKILEKYGS